MWQHRYYSKVMESHVSTTCFRRTLTHSIEELISQIASLILFLSGRGSCFLPDKKTQFPKRFSVIGAVSNSAFIDAFVASFFFFCWTTQIDSLGDLFLFVPWTTRPLDDASLGRCVPWTMRPLDDASLGRWVPWTMRPLDDESLGRCVSWTMHPLEDASQHWTAYRWWVNTTQLLAETWVTPWTAAGTMYPRPMCPRTKILGYCVPCTICSLD
jgi:hypothetical protein